ncbi:Cell wall protein [Actinidia chinensis var. chinensis]|uniref:Cell wall protein n=1 Tax=Actinidia chinensis var. chinensis TaxID=1590841 RepID=A0A2R6QSI0_ACTCC|nr:Cell wall protein [Actinidia chinensis var. chinensis]
MKGTRNNKTGNLEKPFPGCLGRMVNLFDLSTSVAGNRLLTDKPHHDGSSISMGQSDAARMSPIVDPIEDKAMVSELRRSSSNKSANGTPMKAQEMSKEVESKHKPPNIVAKLMGLDALPQQQPDSAVQRSHSRSYSLGRLGISLDYWQQGDKLDMQMQRQIHHYQAQNENKDAYEIWHQSQKGYTRESRSPQNGRHNENINDRKMALIRQKFTEAKSLATNEKLRQSKQFHDALDVLCSNKDLFLKFLQEPNSLFSQHTLDLQSVPPWPETKRITVLRPSKMVNNNKFSGPGKKDKKHIKKASHAGQVVGWEKGNPGFPPPNWQVNDNPTQLTRIVVLKPSPGKPHDIKAVVSPPSSSPRALHGQEFYGEREDDESRELSEMAKEITWQMHENLSGHRRNEILLSSVFSNGYVGDDSFFNVSDNEFAVGNNIDTEVASPTSRHSWDYINRVGSPYSFSSFSRASYSPESSVCREAKKRLSERWAMMASNENFQEQRHVQRRSSTLGEMLALSDTKNSVICEEDRNKEQKPRESTLCSVSNKDENIDNSPRNILRSKSLPVSSFVFGGRPNVEVSDPKVGKTDVPKGATKQHTVKSSLKGKVSSLFFSRNKISSKEKCNASQSIDESQKFAGMSMHCSEKISEGMSQCDIDSGNEEGSLPTLPGSSSKTSSPDLISMGPKQAVISTEAGLSLAKPAMSGNVSENQDQPSPISVLEPLYEEDDSIKAESSNNADKHGAKLPAHSLKSNLTDKSPPIESIARTLSWDDSCIDTATSYHLKPSSVSQGTEEEERELLFFVESLLSAAGLDREVHTNSFLGRWHSLESLLDPSLRDKYIDFNDKEIIHETRRRQMRSTQKLVFDCVNAALEDMTGYGLETSLRGTLCCGGVHNRIVEGGASPMLVDQVWAWMKERFSCEVKCFWGGDGNSLVVERVVRSEVVRKGWVEQRSLEIDIIGKEIEGKLLEEFVHEAVVELTGTI